MAATVISDWTPDEVEEHLEAWHTNSQVRCFIAEEERDEFMPHAPFPPGHRRLVKEPNKLRQS